MIPKSILLMLFALLLSPAWAEEVVIAAFDFEGLPVGGVTFRVTSADRVTTAVTTDLGGAVVSDVSSSVTVELVSGNFQTPRRRQSTDAAPYNFVFTLFRSNLARMSGPERLAYAQRWPEFVSGQAEEFFAEGGEADHLSALVVSGFLDGMRQEDAEPVGEKADEATSAGLGLRVVDQMGRGVTDVIVHLFKFNGQNGRIQFAGAERTDGSGFILFEGLMPGKFYRAEAEVDGRLARSTIYHPKPREMITGETLVLREADRTVSGVVVVGEKPAEATVVRVVSTASGVPALTTTTDASGYFVLAPIPVESVVVLFERSTSNGPRRASARLSPGREEYLIPFDLVSQ